MTDFRNPQTAEEKAAVEYVKKLVAGCNICLFSPLELANAFIRGAEWVKEQSQSK